MHRNGMASTVTWSCNPRMAYNWHAATSKCAAGFCVHVTCLAANYVSSMRLVRCMAQMSVLFLHPLVCYRHHAVRGTAAAGTPRWSVSSVLSCQLCDVLDTNYCLVVTEQLAVTEGSHLVVSVRLRWKDCPTRMARSVATPCWHQRRNHGYFRQFALLQRQGLGYCPRTCRCRDTEGC